ncbi:MAG: hypothetical protein ACM3KR_05285 [Deltaproteobacteria bacterium]
MEKQEKNKKIKLSGRLLILICFLGFIFLLGLGLLTADSGFNSLTGRKDKASIFAVNDKGNGKYRIDFFGKRQELDTKGILQAIDNTKHFIKSVFKEF